MATVQLAKSIILTFLAFAITAILAFCANPYFTQWLIINPDTSKLGGREHKSTISFGLYKACYDRGDTSRLSDYELCKWLSDKAIAIPGFESINVKFGYETHQKYNAFAVPIAAFLSFLATILFFVTVFVEKKGLNTVAAMMIGASGIITLVGGAWYIHRYQLDLHGMQVKIPVVGSILGNVNDTVEDSYLLGPCSIMVLVCGCVSIIMGLTVMYMNKGSGEATYMNADYSAGVSREGAAAPLKNSRQDDGYGTKPEYV